MNDCKYNELLRSRLAELRSSIDDVDIEITRLLCKRYDTVLELAKAKRALGLALENREREQDVISDIINSVPYGYASQIVKVFENIISSSKALQRKQLNLYFIGMPNCGKTRLACQIGEILKLPHVDTDEIIMKKAGKSIDRIFDTDGEASFRELEHDVLCSLAYRGSTVVATGGGIITVEKNIPVLKSSGFVVFLDRSIDSLAMAKIKNRPLIRDGAQAVLELYSKRIAIYRAAADLTVDPDSKGSVRSIIRAYRQATDNAL